MTAKTKPSKPKPSKPKHVTTVESPPLPGRSAALEEAAVAAESAPVPVPALVERTPEDVAHLLDLWRLRTAELTRVEHVETEGPRRTWTLWENGTQTGHVRGRNAAAESWERAARELEATGAPEILARQDEHIAERCMDPTDDKWSSPWTWEAAGSGRAALGLPTAPMAPMTPPEGGDA